jgi:hypothetical protein
MDFPKALLPLEKGGGEGFLVWLFQNANVLKTDMLVERKYPS